MDLDLLVVPRDMSRLSSTAENGTPVASLDGSDVRLIYEIFCIVTGSCVPIILLTNSLLFWGILLYPGFHMPQYSLLCSLSVGDFLMGLWCIPMYILCYNQHTRDWILSKKYWCLSWFTSIMVASGGSLGSLFTIAIDRYIAIIYPLKYNSIVTWERMKILLAVLWTYILFIGFLPIMGYNNYDPTIPVGPARCSFYVTLPKYFVIWTAFVSIFICTFIPAILYLRIFIVIRQQIRAYTLMQAIMDRMKTDSLANRVSSVKGTAYLMFAFIFMWFPHLIIGPLRHYKLFSPKTLEIVKLATQMLIFANSMMNGPIYALCRGEFRLVYRHMLRTWPWKWKKDLRVLYNSQASFVYRRNSEGHIFKPSILLALRSVYLISSSTATSLEDSVNNPSGDDLGPGITICEMDNPHEPRGVSRPLSRHSVRETPVDITLEDDSTA